MVDSIRLGCRFLALATLVGGACNVYAQMRGCGILNVYDADAFVAGRKIGVAVFEVGRRRRRVERRPAGKASSDSLGAVPEGP